MNKKIYDMLLGGYKEQEIEDTFVEIVALKNLECSDRAFANELLSGGHIGIIKAFLESFKGMASNVVNDDLRNGFILELSRIEQIFDDMTNQLIEMSDDSRLSKEIERVETEFCNLKDSSN